MTDVPLLSRRSAPRFVLLFLALLALFYFAYLGIWDSRALHVYLQWNAKACWALLSLFYDGLVLSDTVILGPAFSVQVDRGCDAYLPITTFLAAVLAFPVPWGRKLVGLVAGTGVLLALNLVRISSLYSVGVHVREYFEVMHGTVWQAALVLLAGLIWTVWARWAAQEE